MSSFTKSAPRESAGQGDLFGALVEAPEGFCYQPDLIAPDEEAELLAHLERLSFQPFDFHGHLANRRVVGFGLRYDFDQRRVVEAPPIPDFLTPLRAKVAAFAAQPVEAFAQVLVNEYRPGAGIGWNCDPSGTQRAAVIAISWNATTPSGRRWELSRFSVAAGSGRYIRMSRPITASNVSCAENSLISVAAKRVQ